ncbi:MAG: hypothetical protein WAV90_04530 [Gordonia amarae]
MTAPALDRRTKHRAESGYAITTDPHDDDLSYVLTHLGEPVARFVDGGHAISTLAALAWGVLDTPESTVHYPDVQSAAAGQRQWAWQRYELV